MGAVAGSVCFLGRAPERGEIPLPAETGEGSAELTELVALKQGARLKCDEAALAVAEEARDSGEDKSEVALTSRVRPGLGTGAQEDGGAPMSWLGDFAKGLRLAGQTSCCRSEVSTTSDDEGDAVLGVLETTRLWQPFG